jgi:hypothetical protein
MEKALRRIGIAFLYVANIILETKDALDSFLFDLLIDDDHSMR